MIQSNQDFVLVHANILKSEALRNQVIKTLTDSNATSSLLQPYKDARPLNEIIAKHLQVEQIPTTMKLLVSYAHPDPKVAVFITNTFTDEFLNYITNRNKDSSRKAIEDLTKRAAQQAQRIDSGKFELNEFMEKHGLLVEGALNSMENRAHKELVLLKKQATEDSDPVAINDKELELMELSKLRIQLGTLKRDLEVQESFYRALISRTEYEKSQLPREHSPEAIINERASIR